MKLHKDGSVDEEKIIPCAWPGCSKTYKVKTTMLNHYKEKHKRSALPTGVEATSTTSTITTPSQGEPELPQPPQED